MWFHRWKQDQGWWPKLASCGFKLGAVATVNIKTRVTTQVDMTQGEQEVLRVLMTLQHLTEMGPKSPPLAHVAHS